jgi:hypothetical protein
MLMAPIASGDSNRESPKKFFNGVHKSFTTHPPYTIDLSSTDKVCALSSSVRRTDSIFVFT